jgi:hypothetical protein
MKKIGIKQVQVLKKCFDFGSVNSNDVRVIYNISTNYRPKYSDTERKSKKAILILEKLELYGYLKRFNNKRIYYLTDEGKQAVKLYG